MENLDSLSVCSEVSDNLPLSNNTSLSGLSLYKNDSYELSSTPKHDEGYLSYDQNILNPSIIEEIEKTAIDKYKLDVEIIRKNAELQYSDKIEKLLRINIRLQQQLENANMQIKRFVTNSEFNSKCHELFVQKNCLEKEISELKRINRSLELENKHLGTDLNQFNLSNDSNNVCINKLKEKITFQQIEIQNLYKNNNTLTDHLQESNISLEHLKKSNEWYRNQLHELQTERQAINKSLIEHKHKVKIQNDEINVLKIEIEKCKNDCDQIKLDGLKQKRIHLKTFKNLEITNITNKNEEDDYNQAELVGLQFKVIDLNEQLDKLKSAFSKNCDNYQQLSKNNSELLSKYIVLQKSLEQSQSIIHQQNVEKKEINKQVTDLLESEQNKNIEISKLRHNINVFESKVRSHKHEREMVETSIAMIRDQFAKFKSNYQQVKKDLFERDKQILLLENEKQTLFMEKNWAVCKSENAAKYITVIEDLKKDIVVYENKIKDLHKLTDNLENKIEMSKGEFKSELNNLEAYNAVLKKDIIRYKGKLKLLNEALETNEKHFKKELEVESKQNKINISILEERCEESTKQNDDLSRQLHIKISQIGKLEKQATKLDVSTITKLFQNGSALNKFTLISKDILNETLFKEIHEFENKLNHKLSNLDDRINSVVHKYQSIPLVLKNNTVQELRVAVQVKNMELNEKERKFNTNCHTLLRKVKEQKRARNVSENQLKQLAKDNASMQINLNAKNYELERLNHLLKDFEIASTTLKETLLDLETRFSSTCLERDSLIEKLTGIEIKLKRECQRNDELREESNKQEQLFETRNTEIHDLKDLNQRYVNELKLKNEELLSLVTQMQELKLTKENQAIHARELEKCNLNLCTKLEKLTEDISQKELCIEQHQNKIELLVLEIQSKQDEVRSINNCKKRIEDDYIQRQLEYEKRDKIIKGNVEHLQRELILQTNEKFFIQRLCKDLKLALNSHKNQNKVLNQKLSIFDNESNSFKSLPTVLLPSLPMPSKVDNGFISDLLDKHRQICADPKLSDEVEVQLDNLRKEISILQEEISKKNVGKNNNKLASISE